MSEVDSIPARARQTAAMMAGTDRRLALTNLRIPTVILHGQQDRLIRPDGGRANSRIR